MSDQNTQEELRSIGPNTRNSWRANASAANLIRPESVSAPLRLDANPKSVIVDANRSAFVVIDMQNDFCHSDGWLAGIGVDIDPARRAIAPIASLLPLMRKADIPVVWVNWGNRKDLANISPALFHVYDGEAKGQGLGAALGPNKAPVLEKNSWASAVVDELPIDEKDICVDKHRMSGFWDTPLDSILRNLRVDTLFFAGVNADQCVLHTLADANFLGYDTILVEGATATTSPQYCLDATLYNARQIFGFSLASENLLSALQEVI